MELIGTFINKDTKVKITLNSDSSYSVSGLGLHGNDKFTGQYWFEDSNVVGFPFYLVLKRNDATAFGTDRALINIVNQDIFNVFDREFWQAEDSYNSQIAVYSRLES